MKPIVMLEKIEKEIEKLLQNAGVKGATEFTVPPNPEMGDLAYPCFNAAKERKISPVEAAKEISIKLSEEIKKLRNNKIIGGVKAAGPYVNFYLDSATLAKAVLEKIKKEKEKYGRAEKSKKEKVMVEYSQPNTHKEFHIGHLRNVCIGSTLVNLFRAGGYKAISANYIGDMGAHVAKCLWYIKKYEKEPPETNKGKWLGRMYAEASALADERPELKDEIAEVQRKLEKGDPKWRKFWEETKKWSLRELERIYDLLGVKFDVWFYESREEKPGKAMVGRLLKSGIAKKGEGGAIIVDLAGYGLDVFLILKSDGSSLYATHDLALAKDKFDKYKIDKSVVVIDTRQEFYFKQLFKTLELAGWKKDFKCITYEFVKLPEGAMASRKGNVVLFDDLYRDVLETESEETKTRHPDWPAKTAEKAAKTIALSAVKFDMLKHPVDKVIVFNKKEALSFEGFTGPYVLYVVARINSLLRKSKVQNFPTASRDPRFAIGTKSKINYELLATNEEKQLLMLMAQYPRILGKAMGDYNPSVIVKYSFDLAQRFNEFYNKHSVLSAGSEDLINARLALSSAARQTLKNSLALLAIDTVDEM